MGQRSSRSSSPGSLKRSYRSFRKRAFSNRRELSATFHILDVNMKQTNLLNINLATEEILMTLPGISRSIARSIVDYRHAIGGFRKVEDLALVSGIGANKLQQIQSEITTNSRSLYLRKNNSSSCRTSLSEEQSLDSFFSGTSVRTMKNFFKVLNVNRANVFQLMTIRGLNQELAANIVDYRERKGSFKNLDQLVKVKGMNYRILGAIRLYLTTESCSDNEDDSGVIEMKPTSGDQDSCDMYANNITNANLMCHRRTKSAPMKYSTCGTAEEVSDSEVFKILSSRSKRPIQEPNFNFRHENRPTFRLALWNLENLTKDKASNPGTKEVICRTIQENGFGIVSFQDLLSLEGLEMIMAELNSPTLPWVSNWRGHHGSWKMAILPNHYNNGDYLNAFIYDTTQGISFTDSVNQVPFGSLSCIIVTAKVDGLCLNIASVVKNSKFDSSDCNDLCNQNSDDVPVIFCGNLSSEKKMLDDCTLKSIFHSDSVEDSRKIFRKENMYVNDRVLQHFTGRSGVVTEGLTHLAIPQGWKWGGAVSTHCPIWIEIFVEDVRKSSTDKKSVTYNAG